MVNNLQSFHGKFTTQEVKTGSCILCLVIGSFITCPDGAVAMSLANGLVGIEFTSRYWLQS